MTVVLIGPQICSSGVLVELSAGSPTFPATPCYLPGSPSVPSHPLLSAWLTQSPQPPPQCMSTAGHKTKLVICHNSRCHDTVSSKSIHQSVPPVVHLTISSSDGCVGKANQLSCVCCSCVSEWMLFPCCFACDFIYLNVLN